MKELKIYIAGKVSPDSVFGTSEWRDSFCQLLSVKIKMNIINLDPTKTKNNLDLNENDPNLIFGRDCYLIKTSDLIIVNLSDDISVGGSQEMLIAKYFSKPLIGIARKDGKFNKKNMIFKNKKYTNWIHPFVKIPCDKIVENMDELAEFIKSFDFSLKIKDLSIIDENIDYYIKKYSYLDD